MGMRGRCMRMLENIEELEEAVTERRGLGVGLGDIQSSMC